MPEDESKQFQITISGNRFSITSPYGEEHVREVEQFLSNLIKDVTKQTEAYGPTNIALLVALNLADELITLQKREARCQEMEKDIEALSQRLDNVLNINLNAEPTNIDS